MLSRIAQSGPPPFDRRFAPTHAMEVRHGGLANLAGGAPFSFTRASVALAADSSGVLRQYAVDQPRFVVSPVGIMSVLREPQRTNKCTNYNAVPNGSLTNLSKGGDAAATLTEVDDSAALAAAGLSTVCSSGKVFKLDNSSGVAIAYVDAYGATGNTNDHTLSAYMRGSGTAYLRTGFTLANDWGPATLTSSYARIVSRQSSGLAGGSKNSADVLRVVAHPGSVVYFILNQLEEGQHETSPIVVAGASATRSRDSVFIPNFVITAGEPTWQMIDFVMPYQVLGSNRLTGTSSIGLEIVPGSRVARVYNGTALLATANAYTAGTRGKVAYAGDSTGRSICLNGGTVAFDANTHINAGLTNYTLLQFTTTDDASSPMGYLHGFYRGTQRPTNAQLQALTTL